MSVIAPAILTDNADTYKEAVERYHGFAERVHIDVADGEFAPSFTLTPDNIWWPQEWKADIHAMVMRPGEYVDQLIAIKPNLIIFHAEAEANLEAIMKQVQKAGIQAGVALLRQTVPETVQSVIEAADHVMVFTGTLGQHGGTASMMQLEKVRLIRNINPDVEIGWDGGVTLDNAYTLKQGGVDVLNVGGTLADSAEPQQTYAKLVSEINKHGVI